MEDEQLSTFIAITSATPEVARGFLSLANGNVERAMELFFEDPDLVSNVQVDTNIPTRPNPPAPRVGRQDSHGVIHIDSDDEGDFEMDDDDEGDGGHIARTNAAMAAAVAQEEEDAAMAKRLQEELYGGGGSAADDNVRAPIARTTETLVAPDPLWSGDNAPSYDSPMMLIDQLRRQRQGAGTLPSGC